MLYQTFDPPPQLAPYVRFYWAMEADVPVGEEFVHRSMADGCVEMVFHYRGLFDEVGVDTISPLSNVQAQSTSFHRFSTREDFGIFGAYLYPFAIPRLFALPASDLTNISPDMESVFGAEGKAIEQQMIEAADNETRVAIISRFLSARLSQITRELPVIHHAVHSVFDAKGVVNVFQMAREFGLSTRQFERKFKEFAGLSPKLFSRVIRFQAATQHKLNGVRDLTEIAYASGYYDQSHFINDFREFSGYTPKEYFWNEAEGTQYIDPEQMSHFSNS